MSWRKLGVNSDFTNVAYKIDLYLKFKKCVATLTCSDFVVADTSVTSPRKLLAFMRNTHFLPDLSIPNFGTQSDFIHFENKFIAP